MASITIAHRPELAVEDVIAIFEEHFGDKYEIMPTPRQSLMDFIVKRSAWTGIAVRLKQQRNKTKLVFYGNAPSLWARLVVGLSLFLFGVLFWYLFVWKGMTNEIRTFIETAEEFR